MEKKRYGIWKEIEIEVALTPRELAGIFCKMDGEDQALFFNELAENVATWSNPNFCFQAQEITDQACLTPEGRHIMATLGEYSADMSDSVKLFVAEVCTLGAIDERLPFAQVYSIFQAYRNKKVLPPFNPRDFARKIKELLPQISLSPCQGISCFYGLALNKEVVEQLPHAQGFCSCTTKEPNMVHRKPTISPEQYKHEYEGHFDVVAVGMREDEGSFLPKEIKEACLRAEGFEKDLATVVDGIGKINEAADRLDEEQLAEAQVKRKQETFREDLHHLFEKKKEPKETPSTPPDFICKRG